MNEMSNGSMIIPVTETGGVFRVGEQQADPAMFNRNGNMIPNRPRLEPSMKQVISNPKKSFRQPAQNDLSDNVFSSLAPHMPSGSQV